VDHADRLCARLSTRRQRLDLQHKALEAAKCGLVLSERLSGGSPIGPGLELAIEACSPGDLLVVWKLDRLGRSPMELMGVVERLRRRGAGLKVLTGAASAIDINAMEGAALFAIYAAFAALELEMNRQRTTAGREASVREELGREGSGRGRSRRRRCNIPAPQETGAARLLSLRRAFNGSRS
jgi:DNA invertase Pin-like site-specific DNA recombinase